VLAAADSGTIAVDRHWRVLADPAVVEGMDARELGRLLVHLVSHLLRDHAARAVAADVEMMALKCPIVRRRSHGPGRRTPEVNDDLEPDAMAPACAPDLPDTLGGAPGGLAEQYYDLRPPGPRFWDCGSGCDCLARPWDPQHWPRGHAGPCTSACVGTNERQAEWLRLTVASELQRWMGLEPAASPPAGRAGPRRSCRPKWTGEGSWPPRCDGGWSVLPGWSTTATVSPPGGLRPSRVIFPILQQPVPDVAVVCDTSGSMTEGQLGRALAEVESLLQRAGLAGQAGPGPGL